MYRDEDGLAQSIDLGSAIVKRGTLIAFACKDNAKSPGFQSYADGATEVNDSLAFCKALVRDAKLGLAPGSAFGPEGEGYVRWCFAAGEARLADGAARLRAFLAR